MNCIELFFNENVGLPELSRTRFTFRSNPEINSYRGRVALSAELSKSFTWSAGVRALSFLFAQTKCNWLKQENDPFILEGLQGSMASSLDLSIAKRTQWLCDMFGIEESGILIARRLINIDNTERKRVGPVRLCVNRTQLEPQNIRIWLDGVEVVETHRIEELCGFLLITELNSNRDNSSILSNESKFAPIISGVSTTKKSDHWFMSDVFYEPLVECDYWTEWFPLLQGVIRDLKYSLHGTVSSTELHRWWFSRVGISYMVQNCALLARSGLIRRIIILDPHNKQCTRGALLHAYVQRALGADIRVYENWDDFRARIPSQSDYLSIFDSKFSLEVFGEMDRRVARLSSVDPGITEELYNDVFFNDRLCVTLDGLLEKEQPSFAERAQADTQIRLIRSIYLNRHCDFAELD